MRLIIVCRQVTSLSFSKHYIHVYMKLFGKKRQTVKCQENSLISTPAWCSGTGPHLARVYSRPVFCLRLLFGSGMFSQKLWPPYLSSNTSGSTGSSSTFQSSSSRKNIISNNISVIYLYTSEMWWRFFLKPCTLCKSQEKVPLFIGWQPQYRQASLPVRAI